MGRKVLLLAVLLMIIILVSFCKRTTRLPENIMYALENPSSTVTPVSMRTLDGQEVSSSLDLLTEETTVIVRVVWNINCRYCKQELLYLQESYADRPEVLLVGSNPYNTRKQMQEYVSENGLSSIVMISGDTDWLPPGVPFTSVYLRDGTLLNEFFGWSKEHSPNQLAEIIEEGLPLTNE